MESCPNNSLVTSLSNTLYSCMKVRVRGELGFEQAKQAEPTLAHLKLTKTYLHTTSVFDSGVTSVLLGLLSIIKINGKLTLRVDDIEKGESVQLL